MSFRQMQALLSRLSRATHIHVHILQEQQKSFNDVSMHGAAIATAVFDGQEGITAEIVIISQ